MGQNQSITGSTFYAITNAPDYSNRPPLKFNDRHGENCQILGGGFKAKRVESFCNGIVFSDRPVEVGERVCFRLTDLQIRWSGVLRMGFTSHDPHQIQELPKYACPDLTGKPGYWAKALPDRYAESNVLIHYYFSSSGDVTFGINGVDKGIFFSGVDSSIPLWCLVDLYGNCTGLEIVDMRRSLNNYSHQDIENPNEITNNNSETEEDLDESLASVSNTLNNLAIENSSLQENEVPLRYHPTTNFRNLTFHPSVGPHISLNSSTTIATRHDDEYSNGYVFSRLPVALDERLVLQILATENMYVGSLACGLTSCDPSSIDVGSLPEDSDMLLDRPEYWVVSKDIASRPEVGDELSFLINSDGSVEFKRNNSVSRVFLHVDTSVPLWMFWDVYGNTKKLRLVGGTREQEQDAAVLENDQNNLSITEVPPPLPPRTNPTSILESQPIRRPNDGQGSEDCKICYERIVDCVLYQCGHMCMCYECALQQWKGRGGGICPMCREIIQDVIKIYRS